MVSAGSILVVDDDAAVREAIVAALDSSYEVVTASTASGGLDAICARAFDLILLDYHLPDIPGTDVLRLVKRYFPSTFVILITGYGSEDVAVEALRGGARDYLRKPFDVRELLARIDSLLRLRGGSTERRHNPFVQPKAQTAGEFPAQDLETARGARAIFRAIRHIEAHMDTTLSLPEVARVAGMSKFHFCRRFRECTGQRFREFLARRRIERAKEFMKDQGRSITDIFRDVGFKDMTNFSRVFKRVEGQLPSQFRRQAPADPPAPVPPPPPKPVL